MRSYSVLKKRHIAILIVLVLTVLFSIMAPCSVYASGWMTKNANLGYSDSEIPTWDNSTDQEIGQWSLQDQKTKTTVSSVPEAIISTLLIGMGDVTRMTATGTTYTWDSSSKQWKENGSSAVHMTVDAVVFGRLMQSEKDKISYVQFELERGNPYGIIGATVYVVFRQAALSLLLVIFIIDLVGNLFHGGGRGRQRLKEDLVALVVSFALLYLMPFIVDWLLYIRNALMYSILHAFSSNNVAGLSASIRNYAVETKKVGMAALYLIFSWVGLAFFINYIGTALIQTVLFGAFPVITIMRTKAKRSFQVWAGVFFPNLFIPLIDATLLLIPGAILAISNSKVFGAGEAFNAAGAGIAAMILVVTCLYGVIPARNAILRAFGGVTGVTPRAGFGGIMGAAMMAGRMLSKGASIAKGGGGGNTVVESIAESADDMKSRAGSAEETALAMNQITDRMGKGMDDTDNLLAKLNGEADGAFSDHDSKFLGDSGNEEGVDKVLNEGDAAATLASGGIGEMVGVGDGAGDTVNEGDADVYNNADMTAAMNQNKLSELNATADANAELDQEAFGSVTGMDGKVMTPEMLAALENNPEAADQLNSLEGQMAVAASMGQANENAAAADAKTDPTNARPMDTLSSTESSSQRAQQVSGLAKEDAAFESGLNRAETVRYNNLKQMDNLNSLIEKNQQNAADLQAKNLALTNQRDAIMTKASTGGALTGADRSKIETINNQIQMNNEQIAHYQKQGQTLNTEMNKVRGRENQFAAMDKAAYGNNAATANAYADSASYRASKEVLMRKAQLANYKTFDSAQYAGSISPQKQADFYKQRYTEAMRREKQAVAASGGRSGAKNERKQMQMPTGDNSVAGGRKQPTGGARKQGTPQGTKDASTVKKKPAKTTVRKSDGSKKKPAETVAKKPDNSLNDFNKNATKGIGDARKKASATNESVRKQ